MKAFDRAYGLIVPARDAGDQILATLESVARQTCPPLKVVVALNDCPDGVEEMVRRYANGRAGMLVYRRDFKVARDYANKARIFAEAFALLSDFGLRYVGNLDADTTLPDDYYERLLEAFEADPRLGIAGGDFYEIDAGGVRSNFDAYPASVNGMAQMFRMECYLEIGGYRSIATGGVDMAAEIMARFRKWKTMSFPEIRFHHRRRLGTAESGPLRAKFREGIRDYRMGYGFLFHALKCARRMVEPPYVLGSLARFAAFTREAGRGGPKVLETEIVEFLRAEQWERIKRLARIRSFVGRRRFGFKD